MVQERVFEAQSEVESEGESEPSIKSWSIPGRYEGSTKAHQAGKGLACMKN